MSVAKFKIVVDDFAEEENIFGETPLPFSPRVPVADGAPVVPQQFLDVRRSLANLENVLAEVSVPDGFQLFAGEENKVLFLIVGVIGEENYPQGDTVADKPKIVYGRRWLIEPTTPTSEVVQTALLAIKKAREHELRERFKVTVESKQQVATPFNCHQDLPLMASHRALFEQDDSSEMTGLALENLLSLVTLAGMTFELVQRVQLTHHSIVELLVRPQVVDCDFQELLCEPLIVVVEAPGRAHFLHQLFNACLAKSDRFVEERVAFDGYQRFSHRSSPLEIAKFSIMTRNLKSTNALFQKQFKDMSYRVDSAKAPAFNGGKLGMQQRELVASYPELQGYRPKQ